MPYAPTTPSTKARIIAKAADRAIAEEARQLAALWASGRVVLPVEASALCRRVIEIDNDAAARAARYGRQG